MRVKSPAISKKELFSDLSSLVYAAGKNMENTLPDRPGRVVLRTCRMPPCRFTASLTVVRPIPLPAAPLVEKNG